MAFKGFCTILFYFSFTLFLQCVPAMVLNDINKEIWSPAEVLTFKTRSTASKTMNVIVKAFGKVHDLQLIPAPSVFAPDFSAYVASTDPNGNNVIHQIETDHSELQQLESNLYTNADGSASLLVKERNGQLVLEGIFDHNVHITEDVSQVRSLDGKIYHVAVRRVVKPDTECLAEAPNVTRIIPPILQGAVGKRALPNPVQPEVFLVIEYAYSAAFGHNLQEILKYLGVFFNAVNRRYDTVSSPKVRNVITGVLQITSSTQENAFKIQGTSTILDASQTLSAFGKWLYDQRTVINKNYDVAIWITSLDLGGLSNGAWSSGVAGIAYVGAACDTSTGIYYKVGLCEDKPKAFTGILTVTHELAHLYGAAHDGDVVNYPAGNPGAANCPWNDGFIMSYVIGSTNRVRFSTCSAQQFNYVFNHPYGACLTNVPQPAVVTLNSTLPGTTVSLDAQCKNLNDINSSFYTPYINEVCVMLWCLKPLNSTHASIVSYGPALEGSPCNTANTMWCIDAVCKNK